MALFNLTEFLLPPGLRLLGLDPGSKRIGVALSDVGRRVASPYGVLARAKLKVNAAEIAAIAAREGAGGAHYRAAAGRRRLRPPRSGSAGLGARALRGNRAAGCVAG